MSSSRSSSSTSARTEDRRAIGEGGGIGVSAEGDVAVHVVADEAYELAGQSLELGEHAVTEVATTLGQSLRDTQDALARTQEAARTESAQLADQIIRLGIPAAALAYVVGRVWR